MKLHEVFVVLLTAVVARSGHGQQIKSLDSHAPTQTIQYVHETNADSNILPCQFASLQCSYRTGCGSTLKNYMIECNDLISNKTDVCSEGCKNTLVGLTSTEEGKKLMRCKCEDLSCQRAKDRVEACRESVLRAGEEGTVVSCSEARWICMSDAECGKALEYYQLFCRAMFMGKRCSQHCKNSLSILLKQRQAAKLQDCKCREGEYLDEEFGCEDVKSNAQALCFPEEAEEGEDEVDENDVDGNAVGGEDTPSSATSIGAGAMFKTLAVILLVLSQQH